MNIFFFNNYFRNDTVVIHPCGFSQSKPFPTSKVLRNTISCIIRLLVARLSCVTILLSTLCIVQFYARDNLNNLHELGMLCQDRQCPMLALIDLLHLKTIFSTMYSLSVCKNRIALLLYITS